MSISASGARELAAFAQVDVCLWRCEPVRAAGFYFDEAERVLLVSDEIDLGVYDCATQVSSDGKSEVGCDEAVAKLFEIRGCVCFAEFA